MDEGRSKALLALSWLWIAMVAAYMAWGAIYEAGLMRWLSVWQLEHWGVYYPERTAFVAGFLLAAPAFWFIRRRATIARAREGSGPGVEARRMGRSARNAAIAGVLAAIVAGGAFLLSQRVPDGSEKAALYDGARLGSEPAPVGKVRIAGQLEPAARADYTETGGVRPRVIHYVGFRPDGVAKDAPMRLFVERNVEGREQLRTVQAFLPEQTGYLIENGIPPLALRALETQGVRVASPHYLLRTGDLARREPYYITAGVAGLLALACLVVAAIGGLQARGRGRLAEALEAQRRAQGS
ncbi:MAG: hypothetical protein QOD42_2696 [Sphingomonadales bacterium]|jgi:hypothetical protein|nr:hypothetical protein [Sphingomonadales bacterium]